MQGKSQIFNNGTGAVPKRKKRQKTKAVKIKKRKAIAKLGLTGSLGALVVSGFLKFHGAKTLHIYSGFGLLAFTVWHHLLNQPKTKHKRK